MILFVHETAEDPSLFNVIVKQLNNTRMLWRPGLQAVPCDPPAFLQPIHAAFMRGGAQLRLLDTLGPSGKDLVAQLASIAEGEARSLQQAAAPALTAAAAAQPAAGPGLGMGAGSGVAAAGALPEAEGAGEGNWLPQCGTVGAAGEPTGDASLQLTTAQLQQVSKPCFWGLLCVVHGMYQSWLALSF